MSQGKQKSKVPRNFKLIEEIGDAQKYSYISFGTEDHDLFTFSGSIVTNTGDVHGVMINCDKDYPITRPTVIFLDTSDPQALNALKNVCDNNGSLKSTVQDKIKWGEGAGQCYCIGDYLMEIRKYIRSSS
jgi:hypothetical protein